MLGRVRCSPSVIEYPILLVEQDFGRAMRDVCCECGVSFVLNTLFCLCCWRCCCCRWVAWFSLLVQRLVGVVDAFLSEGRGGRPWTSGVGAGRPARGRGLLPGAARAIQLDRSAAGQAVRSLTSPHTRSLTPRPKRR
jgi:hypothetical protein